MFGVSYQGAYSLVAWESRWVDQTGRVDEGIGSSRGVMESRREEFSLN